MPSKSECSLISLRDSEDSLEKQLHSVPESFRGESDTSSKRWERKLATFFVVVFAFAAGLGIGLQLQKSPPKVADGQAEDWMSEFDLSSNIPLA